MRSSTRHLAAALAVTGGAIAIAGVGVEVAACYWALATGGLVSVATMAAQQWMPMTDRYLRRYIFACILCALVAAVAGVVVFRHHGIRAALVGIAALVAGPVGIPLGSRIWVSRWPLRRFLCRSWRAVRARTR